MIIKSESTDKVAFSNRCSVLEHNTGEDKGEEEEIDSAHSINEEARKNVEKTAKSKK